MRLHALQNPSASLPMRLHGLQNPSAPLPGRLHVLQNPSAPLPGRLHGLQNPSASLPGRFACVAKPIRTPAGAFCNTCKTVSHPCRGILHALQNRFSAQEVRNSIGQINKAACGLRNHPGGPYKTTKRSINNSQKIHKKAVRITAPTRHNALAAPACSCSVWQLASVFLSVASAVQLRASVAGRTLSAARHAAPAITHPCKFTIH
jgi:hypothetical protein